MRRRIGVLILLLAITLPGCATTESGETTFPLGPIIGLFGMAVDGDDKDDYEHLLDDDCACDD